MRGANELRVVPNPLNMAKETGKLLSAMTEEEIAAFPEHPDPPPVVTGEKIEEDTGFYGVLVVRG